MFSLKNKTAMITGGTSGIGAAVAKRFSSAGANVIITGTRDVSQVPDDLGALYIRADVGDEDSMAAAFQAAEDEFGTLDILVNNAGIQDTGKTIEEHSLDDFERNSSVLQKGVYIGMKIGPSHMNDGGSIINTSSIAAAVGVYGYGQYSMTKAAVIGLSNVAAVELATRSIRVNTILPGTVRTPMVEAEPGEIAITEIITPMGRIAETDDLVGLYHFLASDESRYITGQKIAVDGGFLAGPSVALLMKLSGEQE